MTVAAALLASTAASVNEDVVNVSVWVSLYIYIRVCVWVRAYVFSVALPFLLCCSSAATTLLLLCRYSTVEKYMRSVYTAKLAQQMFCGIYIWYALCQSRFVLCMYVYIHAYTPRNIQRVRHRKREGVRKKYKPKTYGAHTIIHTHTNLCVYACVHMLFRCKHHCCCCCYCYCCCCTCFILFNSTTNTRKKR